MTQTVHARTCHLCEANCGVLMTVEDGVVKSVKGNPDHVLSQGYICPKATAIPDIQNDPDRLRSPLKKTADGWEEISWDTAYAEIAERLDAVKATNKVPAAYLGNPLAHNYSANFYMRGFIKQWGAKGVYSASTLDQLPHMIVQKWVYGHFGLYPVADIDRTQTMIIVGGNPLASNGSLWTVPNVKKRIQRLQERGGELIVIDPRRSETANIADSHHFIRPGTDTAFFIGLFLALKDQDLINPDHLDGHLNDWETLRDRFSQFDLESCADYCGIDSSTIRKLAAKLGSGDPAILYGRMGVSVVGFGTLNHFLINMINIATGNVNREGGMMFPEPLVDPVARFGTGSYGRFHTRLKGSPECLGELPTAELADEITTEGEGQIGALVIVAGNPVLSSPGGQHLSDAIESLDFMVSIDLYITETSRHADYILPSCGPLEKDHYPLFFTPMAVRNYAAYSEPLFEKSDTAKDDWEILHGLTNAIKARAGNDTTEAVHPKHMLDDIIKNTTDGELNLAKIGANDAGHDLGPLRPVLMERIKTENGKINCFPDEIAPEFARFAEALSAPKSNGFSLIGRRHLRSNNSWLHNSHRLIKGPNRCTLMIHPDSAADVGLSNGAMARVSNTIGTVELETEITDELMPGVVSIPHGFGHGKKGTNWQLANDNAGVSVNDLTDPALTDPLSGNAVLNGVPVTVEAV